MKMEFLFWVAGIFIVIYWGAYKWQQGLRKLAVRTPEFLKWKAEHPETWSEMERLEHKQMELFKKMCDEDPELAEKNHKPLKEFGDAQKERERTVL
jgi:hypothetical protein